MRPANLIPYQGKMMRAAVIAAKTGIPASTIRRRHAEGVPLDQSRKSGVKAKRYLFRGRQVTIAEAAVELGISETCTRNRVSGNRIMEAAEIASFDRDPIRTAVLITYQGETHTVSAWARKLGINVYTLHTRLYNGWPVERAFSTPVGRTVPNRVHNRRIITRISQAFRSPTASAHEHLLGGLA